MKAIYLVLLWICCMSCASTDIDCNQINCIAGPCGEAIPGQMDMTVFNGTSLVLEEVKVRFIDGTTSFTGFDQGNFEYFSCWSPIPGTASIEAITFSENGNDLITIFSSDITVTLDLLSEGDYVLELTEETSNGAITYRAHIQGYTACNDTPCS